MIIQHKLIEPGDEVVRNPDSWCWSNQDGGQGGRGVVQSKALWGHRTVSPNSNSFDSVEVQWFHHGCTNVYRWGYDGKYDVMVVKHSINSELTKNTE